MNNSVVWFLLISLILGDFSLCFAEKIYFKDGRIIDCSILRRTQDSLWIKYDAGSVRVDAGDIERIEENDSAISKYDYNKMSALIEESLSKGRYQEASRLCTYLLEAFPSQPQLHYLRAMINQKLGDTKGAVQDYEFLVNNGAADATVMNNLGTIYASGKAYEQAIEFFKDAIEKDAGLPQPHNNLARIYMEAKDYARAIEQYQKVLSLDPADATAFYNLGVAYNLRGEYFKAKEQWDKALIFAPEDKDIISAQELINQKLGSGTVDKK